MGEYEPNDSRNVTQSNHTAPGEPPRTGPREDAARRQAQQDDDRNDNRNGGRKEGASQPGYGNARDGSGQMEQDVAADAGDPFATPTVAPRGENAEGDPAALRRDAERPLGNGQAGR